MNDRKRVNAVMRKRNKYIRETIMEIPPSERCKPENWNRFREQAWERIKQEN